MRNPFIGSPTNYTGNGGCGGMVSILIFGVFIASYWYFG